jgi:ATP adenylyltransferase
MEFEELRKYITNRDRWSMQMEHIYQPVMIKTLLESGNKVTVRKIAQRFLQLDESQIDYYKEIVNRMPGRVLRDHGVVSKHSDGYSLNISDLTQTQRSELISLCDMRLREYVKKKRRRA